MTTLDAIRQILNTPRVTGCACPYCKAAARVAKTCESCGYVGHPVFFPCACNGKPCRPGTGCEEHGTETCAFCGGGQVPSLEIISEIRAVVGASDSQGDPMADMVEVEDDTLRRLGYVS